jgi:hypothetical protein
MFRVTHINRHSDTEVTAVVKDDDNTFAILYSVRRGGCLFAGTIHVYNPRGGFTCRTIESTAGIALLPGLEVGSELPEASSNYIRSLADRFVKPLSEISPSELSRLGQTGQYTPDSEIASWYSKK